MSLSVAGPATQVRVGLLALGGALLGLLLPTAAVVSFLAPRSTGEQDVVYAGRIEDFPLASVRYFESKHFYLVRLRDGSFLALYDLDVRNQSRVVGETLVAGCRVRLNSEPYVQNILRVSEPVFGFETHALREGCGGSTYDLTGRRLFGPTPARLDRFPVSIGPAGEVKVDLQRRQCERPCVGYVR